MKKLLLLTIVALFLNGCRYINTKERYVEATASPELTIPEGIDEPNSSSTLDVPEIGSEQAAVTINSNNAPPDMPLRTKQSDNGDLRIENINGFPVLKVKTDKLYMWEAMNNLEIENWTVAEADESTCVMALEYNDQSARERENANFIRKIFTRSKFYSDYSGIYNLTCSQTGSITEVTFTKKDGSAAISFLADSVMTNLFGLFE